VACGNLIEDAEHIICAQSLGLISFELTQCLTNVVGVLQGSTLHVV